MSYDDYDEYEEREPEIVEGLEDAIKISTVIDVDVTSIEIRLRKYVEKVILSKLQSMIQTEVVKCITDSYQSKARFKDAIETVMREKFTETYPDAVENKINEMEKKLKEFSFEWGRDSWGGTKGTPAMTIKEAAKKRVEGYIENELAESVKISKEYIEQFAKNYFANNLFRAMGMMDKMLPQTENMEIEK